MPECVVEQCSGVQPLWDVVTRLNRVTSAPVTGSTVNWKLHSVEAFVAHHESIDFRQHLPWRRLQALWPRRGAGAGTTCPRRPWIRGSSPQGAGGRPGRVPMSARGPDHRTAINHQRLSAQKPPTARTVRRRVGRNGHHRHAERHSAHARAPD